VRIQGIWDDAFLFTVSISIDYMSGARKGDWVDGRAQILRTTNRLAFVQGLLQVGDEPCARGSGVFRRGPSGGPVEF
jgi:acyl-coenzyme A thioesterase PaaI-like protein